MGSIFGIRGLGAAALSVFLLAGTFLTGCASTEPSAADEAERARRAADSALAELDEEESRLPQVPEDEEVPPWIESYPSDEDYYIGVGGYDGSEDRAELLESGRLAATRALASEISTQIRAELTTVSREDTEGSSYDSSELIMNAIVEEELPGVEVVDSYYSESIGQWFYLRLSKEQFRTYQEQEIAKLERRLDALLSPVVGAPEVSAAAELTALMRGLGITEESPYGARARVTLAGSEGFAADAIVTRIQTVLDGVQLRAAEREVSVKAGSTARIEVTALAPAREAGAGRIPLDIRRSGNRVQRVTADEGGRASVTLETGGLEPASYPLEAAVDLAGFTAASGSERLDVSVPKTSLTLAVRPLSVYLSAETADGRALTGLESYMRGLVGEKAPVSFADGPAGSDGRLDVTVAHRELPENDYGIVFVYAHAEITGRRGEVNVVNYRTPEIKEGGLDAEQALDRAINKIEAHLADDRDFETAIAEFARGD